MRTLPQSIFKNKLSDLNTYERPETKKTPKTEQGQNILSQKL